MAVSKRAFNSFTEATRKAVGREESVEGTYDHIIVARIGDYLRLIGSVLSFVPVEKLTMAKEELRDFHASYWVQN